MRTKIELTPGYGARLRNARESLCLSQHALALAALSPRASAKNIGRIEREEVCPTKETMLRVSSALNVNPAWLCYGVDVASANPVLNIPGIGSRIAAARIKRNLSQKTLARLSGLGDSAQNIGRIEKGHVNPRLYTVFRISAVLGVPCQSIAYDF